MWSVNVRPKPGSVISVARASAAVGEGWRRTGTAGIGLS